MVVSMAMGEAPTGWCLVENTIYKWMMTAGTAIFRKPQMCMKDTGTMRPFQIFDCDQLPAFGV